LFYIPSFFLCPPEEKAPLCGDLRRKLFPSGRSYSLEAASSSIPDPPPLSLPLPASLLLFCINGRRFRFNSLGSEARVRLTWFVDRRIVDLGPPVRTPLALLLSFINWFSFSRQKYFRISIWSTFSFRSSEFFFFCSPFSCMFPSPSVRSPPLVESRSYLTTPSEDQAWRSWRPSRINILLQFPFSPVSFFLFSPGYGDLPKRLKFSQGQSVSPLFGRTRFLLPRTQEFPPVPPFSQALVFGTAGVS